MHMNEQFSSPRQVSEVEKSLMDIQGKLDKTPEMDPKDLVDFDETTEGALEEATRLSLESIQEDTAAQAEQRNKIAAVKSKQDYESFREPDDSVDVDLSDLDQAA